MIYLSWWWWWWWWWRWRWRWPVAIWERWRPELTKFTQRPVTLPSLYSLLQKSSRRHDSMQGSFGSSGGQRDSRTQKELQETSRNQKVPGKNDVWWCLVRKSPKNLRWSGFSHCFGEANLYCFNRSDVSCSPASHGTHPKFAQDLAQDSSNWRNGNLNGMSLSATVTY